MADQQTVPFHSAHEGYAVVLAEVQTLQEALTELGMSLDWLWHEIRVGNRPGIEANADSLVSAADRAVDGAAQVLATARRFRDDAGAGVAA
ncbi:hypothetical protein [Pseudonocardia sp. NPDC049635]|uniref:hypothetical protein n=1 Tax=Pseudonocardia sp. NPDC049635 TaxID=3155506 RepID=UPI003405F3DC